MGTIPYTVNRNGGNAASRYNWEYSIHNTAHDWFYMNIPGDVPNVAALPEGNSLQTFSQQTKNSGAKIMITANLIGYAPLDQRTKLYSYPRSVYPNQDEDECSVAIRYDPTAYDWCIPDAGNGQIGGVQIRDSNIWQRTSKIVNASYNVRLLDFLNARNLFPDFISMDNEPALWVPPNFIHYVINCSHSLPSIRVQLMLMFVQ